MKKNNIEEFEKEESSNNDSYDDNDNDNYMEYDKVAIDDEYYDDGKDSSEKVYKSIFKDKKVNKLAHGGLRSIYENPENSDEVIKIAKLRQARRRGANQYRNEYEKNLSSKKENTSDKNDKWREKYTAKEEPFIRDELEYHGVMKQKKAETNLKKFCDTLNKLSWKEFKQCVRSFPRQIMKQDSVLKHKNVVHNDIKADNILIKKIIKKDKKGNDKTKYILKLDDPNNLPEIDRSFKSSPSNGIPEGLKYLGIDTHEIKVPDIFGCFGKKSINIHIAICPASAKWGRANPNTTKNFNKELANRTARKESAWTEEEAKKFWSRTLGLLDTLNLLGVAGNFLKKSEEICKYYFKNVSRDKITKLQDLINKQKELLSKSPYLAYDINISAMDKHLEDTKVLKKEKEPKPFFDDIKLIKINENVRFKKRKIKKNIFGF